MSRVIDVPGGRVELMPPHEAGQYDPPMQDWLTLPVSDHCPLHPGGQWGTRNPCGYFLVRVCHEDGCAQHFRSAVTVYTIAGVIDALMGRARRLAR